MPNLIPHFILDQYKNNKLSGKFSATAMFIDIVGFTAMTQELMKNGKEGAEVLSAVINDIFTPVIEAIYRHGGFISTFAGDAFTSLFSGHKYAPANALAAALEARDIFGKTGHQVTKFGEFDLAARIGLSTGAANWKIIEDSIQNAYYFNGMGINDAVECQRRSDSGEIVIDETLKKLLAKKIELVEKETGFYLVKSFAEKPREQTGTEVFDMPLSAQKAFVPENILELKTKGEFRDVVSCFLSFYEAEDHDSYIRNILGLAHQYGGYFNKIDYSDKGGIILVLFGAPVGREKMFARACDFALAAVKLKTPARVGMTFGPAFAGFVGSSRRNEYTGLGMVVNLAARLAMEAKWGEVYIDKPIHDYVHSKYEIEACEECELKGFARKVAFYHLKQHKVVAAKASPNDVLVGREKEFQKIKELLKPIDQGRFGGILYLDGPSGIGKTRLAAELKISMDKNKYNWFQMPCDEIMQGSLNPIAYFLRNYFYQTTGHTKETNKANFEQKLGQLIDKTKTKAARPASPSEAGENDPSMPLGVKSEDEIKAELVRTKSILGAMVGLYWPGSLYEQLDGKGRYENTLYAVKNLLKAESLQRPTIIELEDGHWIDSDSKKFLEVLTRNVASYPFVIISACRFNDDGSGFNFGLLETLENRVSLEHLDKDAAKALTGARLEATAPLPDKTFEFIWAKTEGNPFYIEQLVLYLRENGLLDAAMNLVSEDVETPKTISMIIVARIDRLSADLKEIIKTASVLGREFAVEVLSAMLQGRALDKHLNEGEKENIWSAVTEIRYIFKHALIRDSVYEMQLKEQVRGLHKLAGETIEQIYKDDLSGHYKDLAYHYEKAEVIDKAKEYLEKAGDLAKKNYQNYEAVCFYDRLLKYVSEKEEQIKVNAKKGDIYEHIGKWKEAEDIYKLNTNLASLIENKKLLADSKCSSGGILARKGEYEKSLALFEESKGLYLELGDKLGIGKVVNNMNYIYMHKGDYEKAMLGFERVINICYELGDKSVLHITVGNMGNVYLNKGDHEKAMECFGRKLQICEELGNKRGMGAAIGAMGAVYHEKGVYEKAMECYGRDLQICEELGDKSGIGAAVGNMGIVYYDKGDYEKAIECYGRDLQICEELGNKRGIAMAIGNMGLVYSDKGDYEKAMVCFGRSLQICEELGNKRGIAMAICNMGLVYSNKGDYEKAMECFGRSLQIDEELGDKRGISITVCNMGDIYREKGNHEKAMECFERQLQIGEELGDKWVISTTFTNMGNVYSEKGIYDKAMECYNRAITLGKELGTKSYLCEYQYNKAELLFKIDPTILQNTGLNDEALQIAKEVGRPDVVFSCKVLNAKIIGLNNKEAGINEIHAMLKEYNEDVQAATLHYELWKMNGQEEDKTEALGIYKKLYGKTPKFEYKKRIDELE